MNRNSSSDANGWTDGKCWRKWLVWQHLRLAVAKMSVLIKEESSEVVIWAKKKLKINSTVFVINLNRGDSRPCYSNSAPSWPTMKLHNFLSAKQHPLVRTRLLCLWLNYFSFLVSSTKCLHSAFVIMNKEKPTFVSYHLSCISTCCRDITERCKTYYRTWIQVFRKGGFKWWDRQGRQATLVLEGLLLRCLAGHFVSVQQTKRPLSHKTDITPWTCWLADYFHQAHV